MIDVRVNNHGDHAAVCFLSRYVIAAVCALTLAGDGHSRFAQHGNHYLFRSDTGTEAVTLWVPDTNGVVRGLFFLGSHGGCPGADNRFFAEGSDGDEFQRLAAQFGFGLVGIGGMCGSQWVQKYAAMFFDIMDEFASIGTNPELANVPLIPLGNSNSAATAWSLVNVAPERILCAGIQNPAGLYPSSMSNAALGVPVLVSIGEDDFAYSRNVTALADARSRGALLAHYVLENEGHEIPFTWDLVRVFWEKCIEARYPAAADPRQGPVQLNDISELSGWLAARDWASGLVDIASYDSYVGDKRRAAWLIDQDLAVLYRGMASWGSPLSLTLEVNGETVGKGPQYLMVADPDAGAVLRVTTGSFNWDKIEFYRGAKKIGESTAGPPQLNMALASDPLYNAFTVLAYSGSQAHSAHVTGLAVIDEATPIARSEDETIFRPLSKPAPKGLPQVFDLRGRVVGALQLTHLNDIRLGGPASPGLYLSSERGEVPNVQ